MRVTTKSYMNERIKCLTDLENVNTKLEQINDERNQLIHASLSLNGLVFSVYSTTEHSDNLILCLLQIIYNNYPVYLLNSSVNSDQPEFFKEWILKV